MKKLGIIATINAMINSFTKQKYKTDDIINLIRRRDMLLTNGNTAPIPTRLKNQRQKRKLARQYGRY